MTAATIQGNVNAWRELDSRENDGLKVDLLWNSDSGEIGLFVDDQKKADTAFLIVSADRALDAFQHPFAYVTASN